MSEENNGSVTDGPTEILEAAATAIEQVAEEKQIAAR
jgi:hypothetical protein